MGGGKGKPLKILVLCQNLLQNLNFPHFSLLMRTSFSASSVDSSKKLNTSERKTNKSHVLRIKMLERAGFVT